jgi:hypothetical protein
MEVEGGYQANQERLAGFWGTGGRYLDSFSIENKSHDLSKSLFTL